MQQASADTKRIWVSVIVPVYNAAGYIGDCLDSIAGQDFSREFEVVIVDDASNDASIEICREWMRHRRQSTTLIEQPGNQGVSAARNRGLQASTGKYVMFVDADDLLPRRAISALVEAAETAGVDIVKGNNTVFDESRESAARYNVAESFVIEGEAILSALFEHRKLRGHPWGKLFDRQSLGDTRFPEGLRISEDLVFCSAACSRARSLLLLNETVYKYRRTGTGTVARKYQTGAYIDWLDAVKEVARFCRSRAQQRSHGDLMLRTLIQMVREARDLSAGQAREVMAEFDKRRRQWQIGWIALIGSGKLTPGSAKRLLKLQLALYRIRRKL